MKMIQANTNSSSTLELELFGDHNKTNSNASSLSRFDSTSDATNASTNDSTSSCHSSSKIRKDRKKRILTKSNENWNYFEVINNKEAKCSLCLKVIKTSGNTSNINNHLKKKHSNGEFNFYYQKYLD